MRDPVYVYIAGPLRGAPGDNPEVNVRVAMKLASQLLDEGLVPFIPHLAWYMNAYHSREEADWLNYYCMPWLERCDCVLRFGGTSKGAEAEMKVAESIGKHVFMSVPEVVAWVDGGQHG